MSPACSHDPPCIAGHLCNYSAAVARVRELEVALVTEIGAVERELAAARVLLAADADALAEGARLRSELRAGLQEALDGWASWVAHPEPLAIIAQLRARFA